MAELIFWFSAAFVFYAYLGYPALLYFWPSRRPVARGDIHPKVSIVMSVRNEAPRIAFKMRRLLELDGGGSGREIIVVSDGSHDGTMAALAEWRDAPGVRAIECAEPLGKWNALNEGMRAASGEIVVFTDARQWFRPESLRLLLENFADPEVGAASGELRFLTEDNPERTATVYWKLERWIRRRESLIGSCMGATGAFYAIRRELFRPLPPGLILDDVYTPLQIALQGWRVIHDPRALVFDEEAAGEMHEFRRKVRTLTGNYQLLGLLPALFRPGRIALQFFSHKTVRLLAPVFLVALPAASALAEGAVYRIALAGQAACYLLAAADFLAPGRIPLAGAARAFVMLNAAAAAAMVNSMLGRRDVWRK